MPNSPNTMPAVHAHAIPDKEGVSVELPDRDRESSPSPSESDQCKTLLRLVSTRCRISIA